MQALFAEVRSNASSRTWSKGVELARAGGVVAESDAPDTIVLKVTEAGRTVSPTVTLWPDDEDYSCDCGGEDPCQHVAAAVIAVRRARQQGTSLSPSKGLSAAQVGYRLRREEQNLALYRVLVEGDKETPFSGSLVELKKRQQQQGRGLAIAKVDLAIEVALGARRNGGVLTAKTFVAVLQCMGDGADLKLDGQPLMVGSMICPWRAQLVDSEGDFELRLEEQAGEGEVFSNGVLVHDGVLYPVSAPPLPAEEMASLSRGRKIPAARAGQLVSEVLPALREKLALEIVTRRLPEGQAEPPRLEVQLRRQEDRLEVLPTLVYGDPPTARLDGERLHLFNPESVVPLRDEAAERRLAERLRQRAGLHLGRMQRASGEQALELAARVERLGQSELTGSETLRAFHPAEALQAKVSATTDGLSLRFANGQNEVDAEKALAAWRAGLSAVLLPQDGGLAPLPLDWLSRFGHRVEALLAARDGERELPPLQRVDLAYLLEDLEQPLPADMSLFKERLESLDRLPSAELPTDLVADLRDYQHRGVQWLSFLGEVELGALLADDMGLGKTLQVIAALGDRRTLVVAPASVLFAWRKEIERFRPGVSVGLYHGPKRVLDPSQQVTLTTYAILRLDVQRLQKEKWDLVVLDEAQQIKNPESQAARAAFALEARWRIALSGTPVENQLEDLWSIFHFINRGLLGGRSDFDQRYASPIVSGSEQVAAELRRRIRPFVLRRRKEEVAPELPPRTELTLSCQLDEQEREVYDAIRAATRDEVLEKLRGGGGVMAAFEALLRLRQAACHSDLVPGQQADSSSKVKLLVGRLQEAAAAGHRCLVFSQWTGLLDRIERHLDAEELSYCRLDGSTRDRGAVVEQFQAPDGPDVMLISLKAGGVGLTLTAADHVFLIDPWWNPAVEQQAADRAHRIGQDKPVFVHRIVAADTVEQRILALQEQKAQLAEAALHGGGVAAKLTRDDLLALLA